MAITYHAGRRIQGLSTDEAPTPNLTYDDFPTNYSGWTKSSNDATKLAFSSNRANFSIGETYVDARAYGYDIGFDLDGDYCIDFDFTFTNTPFTSSGQAVAFTFGISTTTADVGGEDPTMNSEQTKIAGYPSGSHIYIYARAKSSAGTNASGNESNTAFPLNSSATQLRYGRLSRSGTTFKVQFFSDSTRETEVANYSVTTTAQTVRYLYLKSYSQNSGQAWAGYLDNIKIYKDQSSPTPVKPTNVQIGSRYEETDTRKMYYYADTLVFTGDYSSTSGWTQATTNTANSGTGAQTVGIDGGWAYANSTGSANGQFVYTSLGTTISDTKWFADFEYYNIGAVNLYPFVLAAGTSSSWDSTQDMISVIEGGTNVLMIRYRDGSSQANSSASSTMSTNTSYFCRLIRDGQVLTLKMYTDSARTSQHGSDMTVTISGSVTGLTTLHHSGITGGGQTSGYNFKVRGTKVYSGVTSAGNIWKELGT